MHLEPTPVSSLTLSSHASSPHHIALTRPSPCVRASFISSMDVQEYVLLLAAFESLLIHTVVDILHHRFKNFFDVFELYDGLFQIMSALRLRIRRFRYLSDPFRLLTGTPRISYSANFHPGLLSLSSSLVLNLSLSLLYRGRYFSSTNSILMRGQRDG